MLKPTLSLMSVILGLCVPFGCTDDSQGGPSSEDLNAGSVSMPIAGAQGGEAPLIPIGGEVGVSGGVGSAGGAQIEPDGCGFEQHCPEGLSCFNGRCVEEALCEDGACPEGQVCVGGLCFDDPSQGPVEGGALAFEPDRMRFTFQDVGAPMQQVTQLVNFGDQPLTLTALRVEGSGTFTVINQPALPLRLSPNAPVQLEVQYVANDQALDSAQLIAETEEGPQSLLTLVAETKGAQPAAPCLELSPPQLYFGSVGRGQSVTRELTLRSCGEPLVNVYSISRGRTLFGELPQTFSFSPPTFPLQLGLGDEVRVPVTYTPRRAGLEGGVIDVRSDDATDPLQQVNLSAIAEPPPLQDVALHVKLSWDTDYTDVDLHLIGPNGQMWTCEGDCYFSNGNPNWGDQSTDLDDPFLDLDDVDGYGPENINLEAPAPGTYKVWVHFWDPHEGSDARATVELYSYGALMGAYGPSELRSVNDVWEVAEVDFPGFVIRPIDVTSNQSRGGLCGGF